MTKSLKAEGISKNYTDKLGYSLNLLENISFELNSNAFTSILAPSGSGKTTILKIIAGLEEQNIGQINSEFIKKIFIPTKPSSFPWLNVIENVRFDTDLNDESCFNIIKKVGLQGYEEHYPVNESIGFRFRISLARALAHGADLIIIDEPFNNMNSITKIEIYKLLRSLNSRESVSFLLGTSNISEAIFLSDKIFLMNKTPGEIVDQLDIELTMDRSTDILQSDEFASIRSKIESLLVESSQNQLYNFSI